jgi:hypothetical protein
MAVLREIGGVAAVPLRVGDEYLARAEISPQCADSAQTANVITAADGAGLIESSDTRNAGSGRRRAGPQGATEREPRRAQSGHEFESLVTPRVACVGHDRSRGTGRRRAREPASTARSLTAYSSTPCCWRPVPAAALRAALAIVHTFTPIRGPTARHADPCAAFARP